ncbi:ATP-binding protein [Streptomyces sp. LS1784]|uniref:ATP-binding protein n=1 Tax=Streptomyces sp. LS1784 TaxID=2851533 RepID=UPI001CCE0124|nr:ATP-binding protein [Streptomyces sp. LS1784]
MAQDTAAAAKTVRLSDVAVTELDPVSTYGYGFRRDPMAQVHRVRDDRCVEPWVREAEPVVRIDCSGAAAPRVAIRPATACLPYRAESVGAARRLVDAKLREWELDALVDDALLIVSELATNAVETGCQTRMVVAVRRPSDRIVRILVGDGSRTMPVMIQAGPYATSGRGLALVHRLTQGRWGVSPRPFGKVVHADLSTPDPTSR